MIEHLIKRVINFFHRQILGCNRYWTKEEIEAGEKEAQKIKELFEDSE